MRRRVCSGLLLALALALPLALHHTRVLMVPTPAGMWRGFVDVPGWPRCVLALLAGIAAAWVLSHTTAAVRRPALALLLAGAPLVPGLTGRASALLMFQGAVLILVATAAAAVALSRWHGSASPRPGAACARPALLFASAILFYVAVGARLPGPAGPQGDEPHYLIMAHSLWHDGDLDLTDEFAQREYRAFFSGTLEPHTSPASPPGKLYSIHSPGLPALLAPAYALGGYPACRLMLALLAALTGALVYRLVHVTLEDPALALGAWAVFTFTPPLAYYAVSVYPETPAALAMAIFLLTTRREAGSGAVLAAVLSAAALPWLHPKFLPLALLGLGLTLARRQRAGLRVAGVAGFILSLAALLYFFASRYGHATLSAAYGPGFKSDVRLANLPFGLVGLLIDRQYGLLWAAPVWVLAIPGTFILFARRFGDAARATLLAGAVVGVGASFSMWWGGSCPPGRFVIPALPAAALLIAPALRAWRGTSAGLAGASLVIVGLAAASPSVLHNRADGKSALLHYLAPTLDLDDALPSLVRADERAILLALALAAALALAWRYRFLGAVVGAAVYLACAAGLRQTPLVDARAATLAMIEAWDETHIRAVSGPIAPTDLRLDLDLENPPWTFGGPGQRRSRRCDLPPGLYQVAVRGRILRAARTAHVVRLDLRAGELLLARTYLEDGRPLPDFPLLLPAGARRLILEATWIQDVGQLDHVSLTPRALVPRTERAAFSSPRQLRADGYRCPSDGVIVTALAGAEREGSGFRVRDSLAALLIEYRGDQAVEILIKRAAPRPGEALLWGGQRIELSPVTELCLRLAPARVARLGETLVTPLRPQIRGAWLQARLAQH